MHFDIFPFTRGHIRGIYVVNVQALLKWLSIQSNTTSQEL